MNAQNSKPGRPHVSMEEVFSRAPFIVEGTVLKMTDVAAPTQALYLHNQQRALQVRLHVVRAWKGEALSEIVVHTWPQGAAPCRGVTMNQGARYILWGQWDPTQTVRLFDWCGAFQPATGPTADSIRALLDRLYPAPAK